VDEESKKLARLWIHAIVLAAVAETAAAAFIPLLSRTTWAGGSDFEALFRTGFLALAGVIGAMALAIFGLLTGRVLDRKLPAFPMRSWIAAHAILGCVYGLILFVASAPPDDPPTASDSAWYVAGGAALGLMVGLLIGGIQAFVLRRAARGSVLWVGYSALAGLSSVITFPVEFYGPQAGTAHDLIANGADFVQSVVAGCMLLPALLRLRPLGDHPIPLLFE